ncbi:hypothetical protein AXG93_725s1040 [Marchantia polymorpha subsp. ruderalis]|uniref:Uncharacterized protein n=1 Tax=Marchantia polymorpha subsp. ruderalis TaxID=1480154 RepID=A0A176WGI9_MARPO|nr:hypothetical protein AXG93_725s1040 [Marchantia polymorpha subsp. ruderalis]
MLRMVRIHAEVKRGEEVLPEIRGCLERSGRTLWNSDGLLSWLAPAEKCSPALQQQQHPDFADALRVPTGWLAAPPDGLTNAR